MAEEKEGGYNVGRAEEEVLSLIERGHTVFDAEPIDVFIYISNGISLFDRYTSCCSIDL